MRGALALLLFSLLGTVPLPAQELDFALTPGVPKNQLSVFVVPIEVAIPADALRFDDDGQRLTARYSIRSVAGGKERVLQSSSSVHAPRGTTPTGILARKDELRVEHGVTSVAVIVRDENAQTEVTRTILIEGLTVRLADAADAGVADARWRETLARADREKKPIVVFFDTRPCTRCRIFERASIPHPGIQRRLASVVLATMPAQTGKAAEQWQSADAGIAFFDRRGILRARWPIVPDTTDFGIILDSVSAVANDFERGAELADAHEDDAAELAAANGLARLGRITDARASLARAAQSRNAETRDRAALLSAILDANGGRPREALAALEPIAASGATDDVRAEATAAIDTLRRPSSGSELATASIRVLPLTQQVVRGRQVVRTHVGSPSVARVTFLLDGAEVARVSRPPFSATLDFGDVPERHVVRAIAFNRKGAEIGTHERVINNAGDTFRVRLRTPHEGAASGNVKVSMDVRVPVTHSVRRVVVTWNDAERATLTAAPWDCTIAVAPDEIGVLRVVAELDDGRSSEDGVLLNAGVVGHADVQLVELPMTIAGRNGAPPPAVTRESIAVREGRADRHVESIATAAETPLTVGLLIDVSSSMQSSLLDVQEAAIGFLESILGPRDRAFVITFDTRARIVQPATSDVAQLRRQIMTLRPDGLTAIHDAMVLGLLQFEGVKGRRAMVVFTDGLDLTSEYSAADVRELARRVYVPIHVVASTPGVAAKLHASANASKSASRHEGDRQLAGTARSTGGSSQALDDLSELRPVYARIEAALRAQILAFVRSEPGTRENEWRPIRVTLDGVDASVFAPDGYYAPW